MDAGRGSTVELEFGAWYEQRFPDQTRDLRRRIRDRWLFFLLVGVPIGLVAGIAAGYAVDALLDVLDGGQPAPAEGRPALTVLAWLLAAAGVGLVVVGVRRARPRYGEPPMIQRNGLQALTARQEWQLAGELRGRRPVPDEDVPVLRHLARSWVRDGRLAPVPLGFALVVVAAGLATDLGLVAS